MIIIVLVKSKWNHHNISDFQRMFSDKSHCPGAGRGDYTYSHSFSH